MTFQKGHQTWNKGIKGLTKANKTSFKKGIIPKNYNGGLSYFNRDKRWFIVCRDDTKIPFARAVMQCHLKIKLKINEIVHHINENTVDDRIENLQIVTRAEHIGIHRKQLLKIRRENHVRKIKKSRGC